MQVQPLAVPLEPAVSVRAALSAWIPMHNCNTCPCATYRQWRVNAGGPETQHAGQTLPTGRPTRLRGQCGCLSGQGRRGDTSHEDFAHGGQLHFSSRHTALLILRQCVQRLETSASTITKMVYKINASVGARSQRSKS
eukprot:1158148-Pelagomonas_calceolata.AAC.8